MRLIDWIASDAIDQCRASDYTNTPCVCIFVCGVDAVFDRCAADLPKWGIWEEFRRVLWGKLSLQILGRFQSMAVESAKLLHVCVALTPGWIWEEFWGYIENNPNVWACLSAAGPQRSIDVFSLKQSLLLLYIITSKPMHCNSQRKHFQFTFYLQSVARAKRYGMNRF